MPFFINGIPLNVLVQENGTSLGPATTINFTDNVTASGSGAVKSVAASGGGGGGSGSNDPVVVPLSTTTGWTFANNPPLSVASINTGQQRVVYTCTAGGSGDGYAKYDLTTLVTGFDGVRCELVARLVGFTNASSTQTYARIGFENSVDSTGFFVLVRGDGRIEWGHMDTSSLVIGGNTSIGAMPLDGTGWLRLRVTDGVMNAAYGQGTTSDPPDPHEWRLCRVQVSLLDASGEHVPNMLNVGGSHGTTDLLDVLVEFDKISVRDFV